MVALLDSNSHYDTEEVVRPFVRKYGLLTDAEWKALEKRGSFEERLVDTATLLADAETRKRRA